MPAVSSDRLRRRRRGRSVVVQGREIVEVEPRNGNHTGSDRPADMI